MARHEGRVLFVRHGLPGELVRARVTEDRGGSFCRADAFEILEPSADRVPASCPVSGPGGAGCCDFSFATPAAQRALKAAVVAEQLRRVAGWETEVEVEALRDADIAGTGGWRTRLRLVVDDEGRAGVHRFRSTEVLTDLRCPQPIPGAVAGIAERSWTPGADLIVAVDGDGLRHIVESVPAGSPRRGRSGGDRRSTAARRAAAHARHVERVADGSGRAVQYVAGRRWEVSATGFWQPHQDAAQRYSDVVAEWAEVAPGDRAWDLYCGAGVFAARLAEQVGAEGSVAGVESARAAVADGNAALRDLPQARLDAERVERWLGERRTEPAPDVVVLDPPRAGAGRDVVAGITARRPARIVHIGCDPAAFARDLGLYRAAGYTASRLRAFDAFPATHHVECLALLEPSR
ncbi:class I SAM-dependent RNA methyltransferase [Nocardia stercoris]|uniref:Class I SAM-dependent RNA methyltransferase n=1 Tax=Nocardia stercoris TaxID=2483361 RepID=A0A3M2L6P8_9NOCA|nr:class I SAM-dependent RNA methyltransferase [Nocardia stercoris]